jgi:dinuclear metal center YbgI/SA1388 family protein
MKRRSAKPEASPRNKATVAALSAAMEAIAPTWAAADWDNVGLLVGSPDWPARKVLLTIDLTPAVLDEAVAGRFDAVVAYHPLIFKPSARMLLDRRTAPGLAAEALSRRIAVYSPHTALDCAPGGTNETLASLCNLRDVRPFESARPTVRQFKLVTFVPDRHADQVAEGLFAAGAGVIGEYQKCSYRLRGRGTFFGTEATKPTEGKKGRLETIEEVRLEVVLPAEKLAQVVAALRKVHPYDEPAFDLYPLETPPNPCVGQGRIGAFAKPVTLRSLARILKRKCRAANVFVIGNPSGTLRHALICAGAAGSLPFEIPGRPCGKGDVVITGEIRHHDALAYARSGAAAIALGHWASERPVLLPLSQKLRQRLPGAAIVISRKDKAPFTPA